ncbi:class I SAM-dependent methyltransferase [Streptacidiphilus fuscans]|uniref:Class I SAM-dependent methyltransferase n=1 Tax=Streptacidiphilus fuscans TaxID=2789292 RepID=A0A931B9D7_9ACTN|nr:methyltransferase domain-containing protein [Streptacidiphilus fuscans]MBF9070163.1 class I SAM-dependent methyltransferase [Streptacidiphilus fuscans]
MTVERSTVFGTTAETYDAARPGYPDTLIETVLEFAGPLADDRRAVEIGAGTGKATVAFAGRGVPVLAVEPDPRMAEVLRRNTAALPGVEVRIGRFEDAAPQDHGAGLVYGAQSWHWLDRATRRDHVFDALAPGGAVALFWNLTGIVDRDLAERMTALDERWDMGMRHVAGWAAEFAGEIEATADNDWAGFEFRDDARFADQRSIRFRNGVAWHTSDQWVERLSTHSGTQILAPAERTELLGAVRALLDANGGGLTAASFTDLFLARAV